MFKPDSYKREREPDIEKVKTFLETAAGELEKEGVPVGKDMRIDMNAFKEVHGAAVVENDERITRTLQQEWKQEQRDQSTYGEALEMLKTAIFYKNLREDFIVVRSSLYDDVRNKVDNILVDRKTGNLVCAFDEVCDTKGVVYEGKKQKVLERNTGDQGAKLKYGLGLEHASGAAKMTLSNADHIPIFFLALPEEHLKTAMAQFSPSAEQSSFEKKLFAYFIAALDLQVKDLELRSLRLAPALKKRLKGFSATLKTFSG